MRLTTLEEYGLRCLLQLAREGDHQSLTINALAKREGITIPNVAKIMRLLRRGQLVKSARGQTGGYFLARPAKEIYISEVLSTLGTPLFDVSFCERHAGVALRCAHAGHCSIQPLLRQIQSAVDRVMGRLTLHQLVRRATRGLARAHRSADVAR
ncbi:MAG: Rrf2 family transcriptional regulator [Vicinamibacteria bacterium]|jgi:Rrf2 family protein|nr:Rrf2 family transcriptional regulator [Vicinamibacteria bacterium]